MAIWQLKNGQGNKYFQVKLPSVHQYAILGARAGEFANVLLNSYQSLQNYRAMYTGVPGPWRRAFPAMSQNGERGLYSRGYRKKRKDQRGQSGIRTGLTKLSLCM